MDRRRGGHVAAVAARLRGALWPIPVLGVLLAVGLGVALPALDEVLEASRAGHPLDFVFGGGPSAARDLLAAIAGSLISVTGLTFSLTVVALQLGSSQYSPRLLQTFVTDRVVQVTLAQFVATFVYALTVLRTVRTESATETETAFVPRLSITVGYLLTLGSVLALVLFLGHLSRVLRVETMLRDVHEEAGATISRELPEPGGEPSARPRLPQGHGVPVDASSSGFVIGVDEERLVAAAADAGAVLRLAVRIGDSVVVGTPVAHVWADSGGRADPGRWRGVLDRSVRLGYERSPDRDLSYSLRKVVDVAVRALSPGTNDPTTAVHALSHASALLGDLLVRPLEDTAHRDGDGALRLLVPQWSATELVALVMEEPVQFAPGQPAVLRRLAALLREVAWRAGDRVPAAVLRYRMEQVVDAAERSTAVSGDERRQWRSRFEDALIGRWEPDRTGGDDAPVVSTGA